ncbi:MAG: alpha-galactosidase [Clostridia bacterium]|nr:alpha-galactosidase [Clostridia bacterium]
MIVFDSENKVFYLHTKKTTYAMCVYEEKLLLHAYYGKRLNHPLSPDWLDTLEFRPLAPLDYGSFSTDMLPLEYSTFGSADLRIPSLCAKYSDGSTYTRLEYCDHTVEKGKAPLEGLPATYFEEGDNTETLTVHLCDKLHSLHVYLSYSVFEDFDAIARSVRIVNEGERTELERAFSASVDFLGTEMRDLIHLDGAWVRERSITRRRIVPGNQSIESRNGCSGAVHNPFIAICDSDATESRGSVWGMSLVYSGNFSAGVDLGPFGSARAYMGINPQNFCFVLEKGESFTAPEAVLVYSAEGLGGMSRAYHKLYRSRLCRGKYRDIPRSVVLNSWETTYFTFDENTIIDLARDAAKIGVDTMVLDDGWFSSRTTDRAGLGDWWENPDRLPSGLGWLAEEVNKLGLRFGLWFEPEMVNPDSELFRKHPEWALHTVGRDTTPTRSQVTLDFSREDVCEYIIGAVSSILDRANIEYVKWDMNRYMSEVGSAALPADRQGEVYHRYILGLYKVLETLTGRYPDVLFESCASGGGRFDPGMLYYMPQVWTSDNSDAVDRLRIQYGTSLVYPYSSMSAHVSVCPNHTQGRITPFKMRCNVAMPGQLGFELNIGRCSEEELWMCRETIKRYRLLEETFHKGDLYRLVSPFEADFSAIQFISEDKKQVIVCIDSQRAAFNGPDQYVKLCDLDPDGVYKCGDRSYYGEYLMNFGIHFCNKREHISEMLVFDKE